MTSKDTNVRWGTQYNQLSNSKLGQQSNSKLGQHSYLQIPRGRQQVTSCTGLTINQEWNPKSSMKSWAMTRNQGWRVTIQWRMQELRKGGTRGYERVVWVIHPARGAKLLELRPLSVKCLPTSWHRSYMYISSTPCTTELTSGDY